MHSKRNTILTYLFLMYLFPVALTFGIQQLTKHGILTATSHSERIMYVNMVVYLLLPFVLFFLLRKEFSADIKSAGNLVAKTIPLILVVYAVSILGNLFINIFDHTQTTDNQVLINELQGMNYLFTVYMAVFAAPVAEESVFRCCIIANRRGFLGFFMLILSSTLFALVHLQGLTPGAFCAYTVIGLALGSIYLKYRNLILNILVHAGYNGLALLLAAILQHVR